MTTEDVTVCPTCNGCGRVRKQTVRLEDQRIGTIDVSVAQLEAWEPAFPDVDLPALVQTWRNSWRPYLPLGGWPQVDQVLFVAAEQYDA